MGNLEEISRLTSHTRKIFLSWQCQFKNIFKDNYALLIFVSSLYCFNTIHTPICHQVKNTRKNKSPGNNFYRKEEYIKNSIDVPFIIHRGSYSNKSLNWDHRMNDNWIFYATQQITFLILYWFFLALCILNINKDIRTFLKYSNCKKKCYYCNVWNNKIYCYKNVVLNTKSGPFRNIFPISHSRFHSF